MDFKDGLDDYGERMQSKFSEAWLKMARLDKLQDTINGCWISPLDYNEKLGNYNYMIIIACDDGLLKEIYGKLTDEEKKNIDDLRNAIRAMIKKYPIHEPIRDMTTNKRDFKINQKVWLVFADWLDKYDKEIRVLIDKTGYGTANKEMYDDDDF